MSALPEQINIALLAYDGVDELDLFGAYAVLSKAAELPTTGSHPALTVYLCGPAEVTGSAGVRFMVSHSTETLEQAQVVLVPGGRGAASAAKDPAILAALERVLDRGGRLYGVCSGSLIIAATGRAANICLAIHRRKRELLRSYRVRDVGEGLVREGAITTVGGDLRQSVKSIDLAFAILADHAPATVEPTASRLEIIPGRASVPECNATAS